MRAVEYSIMRARPACTTTTVVAAPIALATVYIAATQYMQVDLLWVGRDRPVPAATWLLEWLMVMLCSAVVALVIAGAARLPVTPGAAFPFLVAVPFCVGLVVCGLEARAWVVRSDGLSTCFPTWANALYLATPVLTGAIGAGAVAWLGQWGARRATKHGAALPHCKNCGYDLTLNASGRCPECGEPSQKSTGT